MEKKGAVTRTRGKGSRVNLHRHVGGALFNGSLGLVDADVSFAVPYKARKTGGPQI